MASLFKRCPDNPIVVPGGFPWRMAVTFNPGVIHENGRFAMFERCAAQLRPFICTIGMLESDDGVHFRQVGDQPVFRPEDCGTTDEPGSPYGSVQDPRIVKIDDLFYMTFAYRPFAWSSHPTGVGVPDSHETDLPGVSRAPFDPASAGSANVQGGRPDNMTRSGIAVSTDLRDWQFHSWITAADIDDRDVILFPEKIKGKYMALRRPLHMVGPRFGVPGPSIWLSESEDLRKWSEPELVAKAEFPWEDNRIGGSTPPIKTDHGWLVLYHGVQTLDAAAKRVIYRVGVMLLDLENPTRVIARPSEFIMEPETYYERFGAYIPNVIFPCSAVVVEGTIYLYYGVCDTAIALATVRLADLLDWTL